MATTAVTTGKIGAYALALTASTVDTVTFADNVSDVEVGSDGTAAVYFTTDGSTPTVGGQGTYVLPAGAIGVRTARTVVSNGATVKLISAGTPSYWVARA